MDNWHGLMADAYARCSMNLLRTMHGIEFKSLDHYKEAMRRVDEAREKEAEEARCPHCGHSPLEDDY